MSRVKFFLIFIFLISFSALKLGAASYGSDTTVSIVNPFNITGGDNIIRTFGCARNGFAMADPTVSCSFNSIFPVAGPIYFKGGTLWLQSDLILTNTGSFADLGSIKGQGHAVDLPESVKSFAYGTQPNGAIVLSLAARVTAARDIYSLDWSYDGTYLAVVVVNNPFGNELYIYQFTGSALTLRASYNLGNRGNSVRWRPNSYYLAIASTNTSGKIRTFRFNTAPYSLTLINTQNPTGTYYAVAWQGRGNYLAAGGTEVRVYSVNAGGTMSAAVTPTNNASFATSYVRYSAMKWAPVGNKNDLIMGTSTGNFHLYNFDGSTLNHLKNYPQGASINSLDWSATSTYMAFGLSTGDVKTCQHNASSNSIGVKATYTGFGTAVESLSWKPDATELAVGYNLSGAGDEFQVLGFNNSTYVLTNRYGINLTTNVYAVGYSPSGPYIARGDPSTRYLSVYKESYSTFIFEDVKFYLTGNITLGSPLTFKGDCILNARNNQITLTGDGVINVAKDCSLDIEQAYLNFTTQNMFALEGGTSNVKFRNTWLELSADVLWGDGKFDSYEDLTITGPYVFDYESDYTSTIHSNSTLTFQKNSTFKLGKPTLKSSEPLAFEDNSSYLTFDNATFNITNSGLKLTKGTINIYNQTYFIIDGLADIDGLDNTSSCSLILGDSSKGSEYDLGLVLHGNGTALHVQDGPIVLDSVSQYMNQFLGQSRILIENYCTVAINKTIDMHGGWFSAEDTTNLLFKPGALMLCNNTLFSQVDTGRYEDYYLTGTLTSMFSINLFGDSLLNFNTGLITQEINVSGTNNKITGNGRFQGVINFADSNTILTWDVPSSLELFDNLSLNGGRIIFTQDSGLINDLTFKTTGTADLTNINFYIGSLPTEWDSDIYWIGDGGKLIFSENVSLSGVWTFSGRVTLNGYQKTLILENGCRFVLERGAHVTFKDILIDNLSDDNPIVCLDDNCRITFDYADVALGGDYSFNKGSFFVYNDTWITSLGGFDAVYTFSYDTSQTSTIDEMCYLKIGPRARFSIGRQSSANTNPERQPLIFVDATSPLILDSGTLHVTSSGMILTKGELRIQGDSHLEIENSKYDYALILGDGENSGNDHALEITSGARVSVETGKLVYNNITENKINFGSPESTLNLVAQEALVGLSTIRLSNGTITTPNFTDVIIPYNPDPDIFVIGASLHRYDYGHLIDYYVTGTLAIVDGNRTIILDSDDQILTNPGTFDIDLTIIGGGNKVAGIANMVGALNFTDYNSTLTWDVNQKYSGGDIDLKGGRIILTQNSGLDLAYSIVGTGTVDLGTNTFDLGSELAYWNCNLYWIGDGGAIKINNDVYLSGTWTFSGNIIVTGDFVIDLAPSGRIVLERGAQVTFQGISIYEMSRQNPITCLDDNCLITMNYTDLMMAGDYEFDKGSFYFYWNSTIGTLGPLDTKLTFSYTSSVGSLIDSYSYLKILPGTIFSIGRHDSTITDPDYQPLQFVDATSQLILDGSTLHVTSSGMILNKGELIVEGGSALEVENDKIDYGLILGNGILEDDYLLNIKAGGELKLKTGKLVYNNAANDRIAFDSPSSSFAVESEYGVYAQRNMNLANGSIATPEGINFLNYDPGIFVTTSNLNRYDYLHLLDYYVSGTLALLPTRSIVLDSNDQILINLGTFPISIFVEQSNNRISGVGNITAPLNFTDSNSTLTWDINAKYLGGDINLNGGRIIYTQDSGLIDGNSFVGTGTIDFGAQTFNLGEEATTWNGDFYWISNGGILNLNNNVTISGTWTFSGNVIIEGNNYLIDLAPSGKFILERGAQVMLKDISMYNVSRNNPIICLDDNCQITMSVADILMAGDYEFDKGSLYVYWNSTIGRLGGLDTTHTFSYTSKATSLIDSFCTLKIWPGTIFSIGRQDSTITDPDLQPLTFFDSTSGLVLDGSTLHITSSGAIFTKGILQVTGHSVLEIENYKDEYGLIFGDGTQENDFGCDIYGDGGLTLEYGKMILNSFQPNRVTFQNPAAFFELGVGAALKINSDLTLEGGYIRTESGASVEFKPGITFTENDVTEYLVDPYNSFKVKGRANGFLGFDLDDGGYFYTLEGMHLGGIQCNAGTTHIGGVAGISDYLGPITLAGPRSTLNLSMVAPLGTDIVLNAGTLYLESDISFGDDKKMTGSGNIIIDGTQLTFGAADKNFTDTLYWNATSPSKINLNGNNRLFGTWIFNGDIELNGNGNILDLSGGNLVVQPGGNLVLQNVNIVGLQSNNVRCQGDTATLIVKNSGLFLSSDYSFTSGKIRFEEEVNISGSNKFVYSPTHISSGIASDSTLLVDIGVTFSYAPMSDNRDLLAMENRTSNLYLNGCTLSSTTTGMRLTKGTLIIDYKNDFRNDDATSVSQGICFGDGTAENDLYINILSGGSINLLSGKLVYANVN